MEFGTAKLVYPQQSSSPVPLASNGKQQQRRRGGGAVAFDDAESISGESVALDDDVAISIPIRAPVSDDIEDDDSGSFGTEEEDEGDFESASERIAATSDGASPVGSLADGNPTFWYTQSAMGRPNEFRNADPARETFLAEVVHEKGSSDDEVWPLARVKQSLGADAGGHSSSSSILLQATMPVAKLSGDDDDDGDRTQTDEEEVFEEVVEEEEDEEEEEEGDDGDFSVAKVSPYSVLGGLRVAGSDGDQILKNVESGSADALQEMKSNDWQPEILEENVGKFDESEAYRNAMTETLSSEVEQVSPAAMETRPVSLEEHTEESVVDPLSETQHSGTAKAGGTLQESEPQRDEIAHNGAVLFFDSNQDSEDYGRELEGAEALALARGRHSILENSDVEEGGGMVDEHTVDTGKVVVHAGAFLGPDSKQGEIPQEADGALEFVANDTGEESGVLPSAKEGILGTADVNKQQEGTGVEDIVDSTVSVDAPGSVDYDSKERVIVGQEVADIGKDGIEEIPSEGYESKQDRIENVESESILESRDKGDAVVTGNVVEDDALLNSNAKEDDLAEQDVTECGKESDEGRKSEPDDVQEAKEAKVLASGVEGGLEDSHSGQGRIARESIVGSVKVADDANEGASVHPYSKQDDVAKQVAVGTGERNNGWEINEAKVTATVNVVASENSVIKQEGIDKEDILDSSKVVCDGSFMGSDSMHDEIVQHEVIMSGAEASDTRKAGPDDMQETEGGANKELKLLNFADARLEKEVGSGFDSQGCQNVGEFKKGTDGENKELKLLNFADARLEKEVGSGFDSQGCQNVGEFKKGTDVFQSQMLGSLKSKEDKESEGTRGESDAGGNMQDDTPQPKAYCDISAVPEEVDRIVNPGSLKSKEDKESEGRRGESDAGGNMQDDTPQPKAYCDISAVPEEVDRIVNPQTGFSGSGDRDMAGKSVLDKVLLDSDNRAQFEFESTSVDDQYVQNVDGSLVANWDEEADDDDDDEDEEMVESSALAALMEAARSAGTGSNNASFGAAGFSVSTRPTGLGSSVPSLEPARRSVQHIRSNGSASTRPSALVEDNQHNGDSDDGYGETQEKLQMIRVKFLRLVQRLGQSPQNVVVTQVLYRLGLAEGLRRGRTTSRASGFDRASAVAEQQEAAGLDLDFICNIMVLGQTGVGKSATINSIFDEIKSTTDAFQPATKKVQEVLGTIHGIKVRVIDTPGLMPSFADQRRNKSILSSVKKFVRKFPPDIVLYFDRLDMQSRDYCDIPLLKNITDTFGAAIWFNAIVVLTHASSAPPDGRNGAPLSYEMFVAHRSHVVQHSIRQAAGDMRLMNPVSLVENHSSCRTNREGQRVLPNGQIWKPQLLLLCFASKVLAEANSLLKLQDSAPGRLFGVRTRGPPLPFLLSLLLQSRAQLKIPDEQGGEEAESDDDFDELTDSEDGDEYDRLPPFRHLRKSQLSKLTKEQRKAYFDEIDYREKLFQKKQWKEALRRRRNMKKMPQSYKDESLATDEDFEEGSERAAPVAVPMPDMSMPLTFDSDNPTYRYRYLDTASQWLVRPVLETHGWDHDTGYDGLNVEKMFIIGSKVPASISGQITKDKKEASLQLECAASLKHGEHKATLVGFDVQTVGKDLAYTLRSETGFSNFKCNKTTGGLALTLLGDTLATGLKLEDGLMIGKRLKLVVNGGAMMGQGNVAYGGSLEATLRDKDYPIGQTLTTLGLSVMQWHGDLAIGGNLQSQIVVGRKMTMVTRANLNNKGSGQISVRTSSSEQLQIALIGIIPIIRTLIGGWLFGQSHSTQ